MNQPKEILVTGASGLIGRQLCAALNERGHSVRTVSRSSSADFQWDLKKEYLDPAAVRGVDVIIHLAGETVAQRWSAEARSRILGSRVGSTQLLVDSALKQAKPPVFISASGISYYGVHRAERLDESATSGDGFLAEVTRCWEGAAQPLIDAGSRVAFMRTGIVLSREGGALAKMLTPFKMGVGGRIGTGRQQMSWVSLPDLVSMYVYAAENESLNGPINAVAPEPVSNRMFTKTLGKVLGRPTLFPLPATVVKTLFGDMGRETVLSDLAVVPEKLKTLGFEWRTPDLEQTLKQTINQS